MWRKRDTAGETKIRGEILSLESADSQRVKNAPVASVLLNGGRGATVAPNDAIALALITKKRAGSREKWGRPWTPRREQDVTRRHRVKIGARRYKWGNPYGSSCHVFVIFGTFLPQPYVRYKRTLAPVRKRVTVIPRVPLLTGANSVRGNEAQNGGRGKDRDKDGRVKRNKDNGGTFYPTGRGACAEKRNKGGWARYVIKFLGLRLYKIYGAN